VLACRGLSVAVAGRMLVESLDFEARPGRFVALLGRNGAGKTLTLHTLAGLRPAAAGEVLLDGRAVAAWPPAERARRLALLPQSFEDPFPVTVLETALIGRHPHIGFWSWEGEHDVAIVRECLDEVGLAGCERRIVDSLSGGERRRLAVASLLAQDAGVCLLDEPTNHLDPQHQLGVLQLFRARADGGKAIVASLHDPTLAARFADDALLLHGDGRWDFGPCGDVLTEERLSALYGSPLHEVAWRGRRVFVAG
jgi:iron complex transport system ATP-binding protein